MDGRQQEANTTTKQQPKQKTKSPTPMGRSNGRSPHPAHCHMSRVSILSK